MGAPPPPNARFSLCPFGGKSFFLEPVSQITELPNPSSPIPVLKRTDNPDKKTWEALVQRALQQIKTGALQKVVLARETTLILDHAPDPFALTSALQSRAEGAALFCVTLGKNQAFLGATPERLFSRNGEKILVEAVAGTRKRGDPFEQELLASEKDGREFAFVQDYFRQLIPGVQFGPTTVHKTANVQHLFSQGVSRIDPTQSHARYIDLFHPTPALAGTPKQAALEWIFAEEPFSRGFYGGVFGWEEGSQSEWMVTIRSCLLEGNVAKLYTGTGIVAGSDPALEWEELEAKLSLYTPLFS